MNQQSPSFKINKKFSLLMCAAVVFFSSHGAKADSITGTGWKGTNGVSWTAAGNWDGIAPSTGGSGDRNLFFGQGYKKAGGTQSTSSNDLSGWNGYRITFQDSDVTGTTTDGSAANDTASRFEATRT